MVIRYMSHLTKYPQLVTVTLFQEPNFAYISFEMFDFFC